MLSGNVAKQGLNHMDDVGLPQLEEDEMHDTRTWALVDSFRVV